jgi:hypothetical protein
VSVFPTTDPDTIRDALGARLVSIKPSLEQGQLSRWTWLKDREVAGTLRSFDLRFAAETEVGNGDGRQGAYGGGIQYECVVELVVSYPVTVYRLPRFLGSDARDLSAILADLHTYIPGDGMFAQMWSQDRRVVSTWTGSDGAYIGTHTFTIDFFAVDSVQVAV